MRTRKHPTGSDALSSIRLLLIGVIAVLALAGCASAPGPATQAKEYIFYPPLPNPPRIQYLTSFSSSRDVVAKGSGFSDFILGEDPGTDFIEKPYGVKIFSGKIYAVDTRGPSYVVIDLVGKAWRTVYGEGEGRMRKPINITIDVDGTKYVTDTGRDQVLVFSPEDRFLRALGVEGQFRPGDTAIDGDRLYVADMQDHEIEVVNKVTGAPLYKIGSAADLPEDRVKEEGVYYPTNLAISGGYLYVAETGNFRIKKFTLDGKYVSNFGGIGLNFGKFVRPKGIDLDRNGRMYVVDSAFENVQILDPNGTVLLFFGGPGSGRENMNLPVDIDIDYDNVDLFRSYAAPDFDLEFLILVSSQFGMGKINVYGFGRMRGVVYPNG